MNRPGLERLAAIGVGAADAYVGDGAAIVDVAAEAEVAGRGITLVLVAVGLSVRRVAAAAVEQAGHAQAVVPALHVGDRGHPHVRGVALIIPLIVALVVPVGVAIGRLLGPVLGGCLRHRRARALLDRSAVGHIVAVAQQLVDDLAEAVLLVVAVARLLGVARLRRVALLLRVIAVSRLAGSG